MQALESPYDVWYKTTFLFIDWLVLEKVSVSILDFKTKNKLTRKKETLLERHYKGPRKTT